MYEAEVPLFMQIGFGLVTLIFVTYQIHLFLKLRNIPASLCFAFQWISTALAFERILSALQLRPTNHPMFSEEFSMRVGTAGLFWGISILLMLLGLELLHRKQK